MLGISDSFTLVIQPNGAVAHEKPTADTRATESGENSSTLLRAVSQPVLLSSHAQYCIYVCMRTTIVLCYCFTAAWSHCEGSRTLKKSENDYDRRMVFKQ